MFTYLLQYLSVESIDSLLYVNTLFTSLPQYLSVESIDSLMYFNSLFTSLLQYPFVENIGPLLYVKTLFTSLSQYPFVQSIDLCSIYEPCALLGYSMFGPCFVLERLNRVDYLDKCYYHINYNVSG